MLDTLKKKIKAGIGIAAAAFMFGACTPKEVPEQPRKPDVEVTADVSSPPKKPIRPWLVVGPSSLVIQPDVVDECEHDLLEPRAMVQALAEECLEAGENAEPVVSVDCQNVNLVVEDSALKLEIDGIQDDNRDLCLLASEGPTKLVTVIEALVDRCINGPSKSPAVLTASLKGQDPVTYCRIRPAEMTPDWAAPTFRRGQSIAPLKGYSDGTFRPADKMQRAEPFKMSGRALGKGVELPAVSNDFEDVSLWTGDANDFSLATSPSSKTFVKPDSRSGRDQCVEREPRRLECIAPVDPILDSPTQACWE